MGGGTLLDAGIYPFSFASMVFGAQPARIMSTVHIGETGWTSVFSLLFEYESGAAASLHGSVQLEMSNEAWIYGTKGKIHVPQFLFARKATLYVNGEEPVTVEDDDRTFTGHSYQAVEAMACLREGRTESAAMPLDETLRIMETLTRSVPMGLEIRWGIGGIGDILLIFE
ncbi:Gfo/Idh/MocA family protein [Cohnella faecalis]|uniref:Gfo/Idh/MocA family protein n=1 Tax=Cohnella faecalis TaxID=2315694 RepID=UPI001F1A44D0|nr:hypothetical protein [Cohnella faecalis]